MAESPTPGPGGPVQGEGDYESARRYQKDQQEFAKDADRVEKAGKDAEKALDGPEGEELERARRETGQGHH